MKKRRVKTDSIIILLLSFIIIVLAIFLIILLLNTKKCKCDVCEEKTLANSTEIVCGDNSDLSRFLCNRFRESGYIITFKEGLDENVKRSKMSTITTSLYGAPVMYIDKSEVNNYLRTINGLQEEKDYGIDSFIFVMNNNNKLKKEDVEKAIQKDKDLDKVIPFLIKKDSN